MWHNSYLFLDTMDKKEEKIFSRYKIKLPKLNKIIIKDNKKLSKIIRIIAILVIAIIVFKIAVEATIPIIDEQCKTMAKSIATKISNEQATDVMANYEYEDFCEVIKDENDNIKMIGVNMITVNEVISDIPILIQEELEKEENSTFNIKLRKLHRKQILCRFRSRCKNTNDDRWNSRNRLKNRICRSGYKSNIT